MTYLKDLARRVSELQGPSREVDALIEVELRRLQAYAVGLNDSTRAKWQAHPSGKVGDTHTTYVAPRFTASLDAAMTLVPEGWMWSVGGGGPDDEPWACVTEIAEPCRDISFDAATPAVALTAAALIARSEA